MHLIANKMQLIVVKYLIQFALKYILLKYIISILRIIFFFFTRVISKGAVRAVLQLSPTVCCCYTTRILEMLEHFLNLTKI